MHFTCAARTDVGIVRSGNEDNYLMLAERGIFIVADGMGGHAAGEVASEMAVRITSHQIGSLRGVSFDGAAEMLERVRGAAGQAFAAGHVVEEVAVSPMCLDQLTPSISRSAYLPAS